MGGRLNKRNEYFTKFGVTVLTLTDSVLADLKTAFGMVIPYLSPGPSLSVTTPQINQQISSYVFGGK